MLVVQIKNMVETWPDGQEKRYRYRITSFGKPVSGWRETRALAMKDAVRLGLASYDEAQRETYLTSPIAVDMGLLPKLDLPSRDAPRPWTGEDVAALKRLAPTVARAADIARAIGRTEGAVIAQARRLNIELRNDERDKRDLDAMFAEAEKAKKKPARPAPRHMRVRAR